MSRALVTGATGLLGSHLVERLLGDGWRVRALVRSTAGAGVVEAAGAEAALGDLSDAEAVLRAARGCDAIAHAAAQIGPGGDWASYRAGNVVGAAHVVEAATRTRARLVHVSSTAVYGDDRYHGTPTDEDVPLPRLPSRDVYGRSKQQAERLVLAAHRGGQAWCTVVRPPLMYGRGDRQFAPRVGPVFQRGVFPLLGGGDTTLPLVHASAVADGAVRALGKDGAGGRVYLLTDDFPVTARDLVRWAAAGLGRPIRAPVVPVAVGYLGIRVLALALAVGGRGEVASHAPGTFRMLTRDNPFTSARARAELGWTPHLTPDVGIPEAFRSWRDAACAARGRPS